MAGPLAMAAAFMKVGSTALNIKSILDQGEDTYENAMRSAAEMRDQGDAALASATYTARADRQAADELIGDTRAAAAAGGGLASDAGTIERLADIDERDKFNSMAALFRGKTQRKQAYGQAAITERAGKKAYTASRRQAFATALSGGAQAAGFLGG